jgi:hypothetical protein
MTGPSSHVGEDHQPPQGDTEADQGVARDQGNGTAHDPTEGHLESAERRGDVV